jgi:chromosome segregation ATPase
MNNISYLQAVTAYTAQETSSGKSSTGMAAVAQATQKRKDLEHSIEQLQANVERLTTEMEGISRADGFERTMRSIFGDDMGAGRISDEMGRSAAEMKKAQAEILAQQSKIELTLQELQTAQAELGQRSSERQKTYDEAESAIVAGG